MTPEDKKSQISSEAGKEHEQQRWLLMTDPEKFPDSFTRDLIIRTRAQAFKKVAQWLENNLFPSLLKVELWKAQLKELEIDERN